MLSDVLKVALRGDMVMAPNSIKTKEEEEGTTVIKSEVIKTDGRSVDMFAPAWVQENTQVLKSKVESSKVLKTKVAETPKKLRKDDNPSIQSRPGGGDVKAKIVEEVAERDEVQIFGFLRFLHFSALV